MNEYRDDLVKLMRHDNTTYGGMRWGDGVTNTATGSGTVLCTDGVIHAYRTMEQAAIFAPAHSVSSYLLARVSSYLLARRASGYILRDSGDKVGCKSLTTHELIALPRPTMMQRAYAAIRCAQDAAHDSDELPAAWHRWAENWLSGKDRSVKAARAARKVAWGTNWSKARDSAGVAVSASKAAQAVNWAVYSADWANSAAAEAAEAVRRAATGCGVNIQPILEEALAWQEYTV